MTCPRRAQRLWLVISIALLWLTAVGAATLDPPFGDQGPHTSFQPASLSAPVRGWITLILQLLKGQPLSYGYFHPYPWLPLPDP